MIIRLFEITGTVFLGLFFVLCIFLADKIFGPTGAFLMTLLSSFLSAFADRLLRRIIGIIPTPKNVETKSSKDTLQKQNIIQSDIVFRDIARV